MQVLALSGQALKLDLVVIVDLPNTLHLDAWMQAEETAHTVFPLQENLWGKPFRTGRERGGLGFEDCITNISGSFGPKQQIIY